MKKLYPLPDEAVRHFNKGNVYEIIGEYAIALKEYKTALDKGFNDKYGLCQFMIDVGVNAGLLERKTEEGVAELKRIDRANTEILESVEILKYAMSWVDLYEKKNRSTCTLQG